MAGLTARTEKTVRTAPEMEEITASRAASTIIMERAVLIIGITAAKGVRAVVSGEIRIVRTTGESARTVRIITGTVPRAVLTTEKTVPDPLEIIASRAVSEERTRAGEIPEENREI